MNINETSETTCYPRFVNNQSAHSPCLWILIRRQKPGASRNFVRPSADLTGSSLPYLEVKHGLRQLGNLWGLWGNRTHELTVDDLPCCAENRWQFLDAFLCSHRLFMLRRGCVIRQCPLSTGPVLHIVVAPQAIRHPGELNLTNIIWQVSPVVVLCLQPIPPELIFDFGIYFVDFIMPFHEITASRACHFRGLKLTHAKVNRLPTRCYEVNEQRLAVEWARAAQFH